MSQNLLSAAPVIGPLRVKSKESANATKHFVIDLIISSSFMDMQDLHN